MNARIEPHAADSLRGRIVAAIAKATSKHPANATEVQHKLGADEAEFWVAMKLLFAEGLVNSASIQRGTADPWLAIWPTGLPLGNGAWTNNSHSALFEKPRVHDLYQAFAPRSAPLPTKTSTPATPVPPAATTVPDSQETPMTTHHRKKGELKEAFVALLETRRGNPVTLAEGARVLQCTPDNLRHSVTALLKAGTVIEKKTYAGSRGVAAFVLAPKADEAGTEAPAAAAAAAPPEPAVEPDRRVPQPLYREGDLQVKEIPDRAPSHPIEFALWDDGRLTIADGDEIVQLPADATKRLALLLGVPGAIGTHRPARPAMYPTLHGPAVAAAA